MRKILFPTLLVFGYLATRLINLTNLPIFTDESIYIYWAKVISQTHQQWFISLTDGKPPVLIWLISAFLSVFPSNLYLLAGRIPVVLIGLTGVVGFYKLARVFLKSESGAVVASVFYLFSPFILFYDRMALFDSPLSAILVWTTYFTVRLSQTLDVKHAILAGLSLGMAFLFKPTSILFLALIPFILLVLNFDQSLKKNWMKIVGLTGTVLIIGEIVNNLLRISRVYFLMEAKNQQFQQPLAAFLSNPFSLVPANVLLIFETITGYYTWPVFLLGITALLFFLIKDWRKGMVVGALWFGPLLAFCVLARELFPRYILFTTPYFFLPIGHLFTRVSKKIAVIGVVGIILFAAVFDYWIITNPSRAPLPKNDYNQYVSEHPSGYGLDKTFAYINKVSQNGPVTVVTQGTFGLYPYAFQLEYWNNNNIRVIPRWPLGTIDKDIYLASRDSRVLIVLKEFDQIPGDFPLSLLEEAEKPGGKYPILITELK